MLELLGELYRRCERARMSLKSNWAKEQWWRSAITAKGTLRKSFDGVEVAQALLKPPIGRGEVGWLGGKTLGTNPTNLATGPNRSLHLSCHHHALTLSTFVPLFWVDILISPIILLRSRLSLVLTTSNHETGRILS